MLDCFPSLLLFCDFLNLLEVRVAQSCPTLCDPIDCSPWNSPGQNTGVGSFSFLHRIFPTQGSNPGFLHCRRILYQLSHKGSPVFRRILYELSQSRYSLPGGYFTSQEFLDFDPRDHSLPGSSVLGILQARILDWVGVSTSASVLSMNIQD